MTGSTWDESANYYALSSQSANSSRPNIYMNIDIAVWREEVDGSNKYGKCDGLLRRCMTGGRWNLGQISGSRHADCHYLCTAIGSGTNASYKSFAARG